MGVKGLWRLLLPIGRRVSMETLHGKVLAIDASIWLTQFLKAMRNPETGRVQAAAHLIGFFRRLCRLTFHGIRPIFVFDGATPEIKQRELALRRKRRTQFATLGDASVQRLARRLLAETLKQQKQTKSTANGGGIQTATSAFAAGFNPGRSEREEQQPSGGAAEEEESAEKEQTREQKKQQQQPVIDLLEEVSLPDESAPKNQVSDWDNPIPVDSDDDDEEESEKQKKEAASAKKTDQQEDDDSSSSDGSVEYEDFGLNAVSNNHKHNDLFSNEHHEASVRRISSLPAEKRKDAIEDAKRRLRLQSRREFMPAAANADQFSQVQLSNFLRSSRLNQALVKMATKAAQKDNEGLRGEVMASDRTTRVELIRENEKATEQPSKRSPNNNKSRGSSNSRAATLQRRSWQNSMGPPVAKRMTRQDDEEQSSDEEFWHAAQAPKEKARVDTTSDDDEDLDRKPAAKPSLRRRHLALAVDESSSSSSEEDDREKPLSRGDNGKEVERPSRQRGRRVFAVDESSDDDDDSSEGGGGFFAASSSPAHAKSSRPGVDANGQRSSNDKPRNKQKSMEIEIVDSDESDGEEGGGFLPKSRKHSPENRGGGGDDNVARAKPLDETTIDLTGDASASGKSDAVLAQELADRALAEALQEAEDADTAAQDAEPQHERHSTGVAALSNRHPPNVDKSLSKSLERSKPSHKSARESSDGEDDDTVDWEDGELDDDEDADRKSDGQAETKVDSPEFLDCGVNYSQDSKGATRTDKIETDGTHTRAGASVSLPGRDDDGGSASSDDDVAWEDGDLSNNQSLEGTADDTKQLFGSSKHASSPPENVEGPENEDSMMWDTDRPAEQRRDADSNMNAETTAALERAQETASNLANWAGRVFRRAMKEVNEANADDAPTNVDHQGREGGNDEVPDSRTAPNRDADSPAEPRTVEEQESPTKIYERFDTLPDSNHANPTGVEQREGGSSRNNGVLPEGSTLDDLADDGDWEAERNRRERDMDTVTDEMREEAIRLLQLFGVPFIKAPSEAEAQCVTLEALGLVDGIVTDDSDVFVFGGKTVYKNIFDEMKYVEVYLASDAEKEMALSRNHMVALAMLLGGDYTEGVKGVGIVNGMEILETFDVSTDLKAGLGQFKKWLDGFDPAAEVGAKTSGKPPATREELFHSKHRSARTRWVAPDSFPSERVMKAYLNPVVDKSETPFSWGSPDVDGLVAFCERNVGWPREETMRFLGPVINNVKKGYRQTRIDSYMTYDDGIKFADVKSKRLREVLGLTEEKDSGTKGRKKRHK